MKRFNQYVNIAATLNILALIADRSLNQVVLIAELNCIYKLYIQQV